MDGASINGRLDYAFLKVNSQADISALRQAVKDTSKLGLRSICLPPVLAGTVKKNFPTVRVSAVVSYPLGMDTLDMKAKAIEELIGLGVDEVDVVYDLFALVNGNWGKLEEEAARLGKLTSRTGVFHKAIIETPILGEGAIRRAAEILLDSPVDCIKTSTGYDREPTSIDHVRLLREVLGARKHIKAAGGIRTYYHVCAMLDGGADIVGTSNAVKIAEEVASRQPASL